MIIAFIIRILTILHCEWRYLLHKKLFALESKLIFVFKFPLQKKTVHLVTYS